MLQRLLGGKNLEIEVHLSAEKRVRLNIDSGKTVQDLKKMIF